MLAVARRAAIFAFEAATRKPRIEDRAEPRTVDKPPKLKPRVAGAAETGR
jgi:hypothetical protein